MTRRLDDEKKDWMSWMLNKRRESSRNMQPIAEAPARPPGAAQGKIQNADSSRVLSAQALAKGAVWLFGSDPEQRVGARWGGIQRGEQYSQHRPRKQARW